MKIVDYIIVSAKAIDHLEVTVQRHIEAGYEPLAGICLGVSEFSGGPMYLQAMVKYAPVAKDRPVDTKLPPMGYAR